jgi:hypothetical protein
MMKKIAEIFMDDEGEKTIVRIDFAEGFNVIKKLGVLEVAKASIMEASSRDIALMEYNAEEI